jgi:hypothetical protein
MVLSHHKDPEDSYNLKRRVRKVGERSTELAHLPLSNEPLIDLLSAITIVSPSMRSLKALMSSFLLKAETSSADAVPRSINT